MALDFSPIFNLVLIHYTVILAYTLFIGVRSLRRHRVNLDTLSPAKSQIFPQFLIIIPAYNEERCIQNLLSDLKEQTYPYAHYRVLVVADNCTDRTVQVVKAVSANASYIDVLEKHDTKNVKADALSYAFNHFTTIFPQFHPTHVMVFDSDNRIKKTLLDDLVPFISQGYLALQINVKTKNLNTLLTRLQYYDQLIFNRLMQWGRDGKLTPILRGTGECINYQTLVSVGGFGKSFADDFWLTIKLAEQGIRIKYLHHLATWDEKPSSIIIETRRRSRWIIGYFDCAKYYLSSLIRHPSRLKLDLAINVAGVFNGFLFWFVQVVILLASVNLVFYHPYFFFGAPEYVLFATLSTQLLYGAICWAEGDRYYIFWALPLSIFLNIWIISTLLTIPYLLRRKRTWYHTPHTITTPPHELLD